MSAEKCLIILSEKSSGSSALQNFLVKFANAQHVSKTRHFENETLYWTKAASILNKPQLDMVDSEVPIKSKKARVDLIKLLKANLNNYVPPDDNKKLIFEGWRLLCNRYSPIFLEKSPHHLCQWSAIELIIECIEKLSDVDFLLIGLIRNPMDTIYSQYKRWKSRPEEVQNQWLIAYKNLLKLKEIVGDQIVFVRYEDLATSPLCLAPVFNFCEIALDASAENYFHHKSIRKWKTSALYSFSLSPEVAELASQYGYQKEELDNETHLFWPLVREVSRAAYKTIEPFKKVTLYGAKAIKSISSTI